MLSSSQLKEAFDEFDKDKNGYMSLDEIVKLSSKLGVKVAKRDLEALFHSIDTDKDNKLSFEEFLAWYRVGKNSNLAFMLKYQLGVQKAIKSITPEPHNLAKR